MQQVISNQVITNFVEQIITNQVTQMIKYIPENVEQVIFNPVTLNDNIYP